MYLVVVAYVNKRKELSSYLAGGWSAHQSFNTSLSMFFNTHSRHISRFLVASKLNCCGLLFWYNKVQQDTYNYLSYFQFFSSDFVAPQLATLYFEQIYE